MSSKPPLIVILDLNNTDELFNAPDSNPFSTHTIEVLGESGIDHVKKYVDKLWPHAPGPIQLTLRLPADQITPDLPARLQTGIQRYCAEQVRINREMRRNTINISWRQLIMAFGVLVLAAVAIYFGIINPQGILRPLLGPLVAVLILFAGSVSIFDALWSVMFDWIPYVLDARAYERIQKTEVIVKASAGD